MIMLNTPIFVKEVYKFLQKHYPLPKNLPPISKIKTLDDIFQLRLTHFKVGKSRGYLDQNLCLLSSKKQSIKLIKKIEKLVKQKNYFRLSSFSIQDNWKQLSETIGRLYKVRDKYKTLYFNVEDNGGGDMIPCHIILYCLCGGKQKWMKNYKTIDNDGKNVWINSWNPWCPWINKKNDGGQHDQFLQMNLMIPNYDKYKKPYQGKIVIFSNHNSSSSTWYFITFLIYMFAKHNIKRFTTKTGVKVGKVISDKLVICGCTDTQSGDGNAIEKKIKGVIVKVPTQETIFRPVYKYDYLRYWM